MTPSETSRRSELPTHVPSERERADLELLCAGALAPLDGFDGPDGLVPLVVPDEVAGAATAAGGLTLLDQEGARRATVLPTATRPTGEGRSAVVGAVQPLPYDGASPFRRLRLGPEEARRAYGDDYLLVVVDAPLTADDLETARTKAGSASVVLLVLHGMARGVRPHALVRATLAAAETLQEAGTDAAVVVAPVLPRAHGDGPRDEEFVGRVVGNYAAGEVVWPTGHGPLPARVQAVVEAARPADDRHGLVLFFTGLSGSGKSTVAREVQDVLLEQYDREITSLDGDVVRRELSEGLGFSAEDRDRNIRRIGWVAAEIARHGGLAVVSPIAPFDATRRHVRRTVTEAGGAFVLVHVATPLEECERRDRKGLYARARAGEIPDFTGISSPYEVPADADVRIDTTDLTVAEAAEAVLAHLRKHGHLSRGAHA